jgi:hypothetical protein
MGLGGGAVGEVKLRFWSQGNTAKRSVNPQRIKAIRRSQGEAGREEKEATIATQLDQQG